MYPNKPLPHERFTRWWKLQSQGKQLGLGVLIIGLLATCGLCSAVGNAAPKVPVAAPVAISTPTQLSQQAILATLQAMVPTPTPKPTPKPKPTAVPARTTPKTPVSTPPILGTDLSIFTAKYGKPNDHSTASTGSYHYQRYSGSNIDFLILQTDLVDAGYDQKVEWVTANASDRGNGWTTQQADTTCAPFFPSDAVYKSQVPLSNGGYDKIYYSASLAHLFPAPAFTDANTNQVKAGTFDVEYITQSGSGSNIGACSILIGTQQTQN